MVPSKVQHEKGGPWWPWTSGSVDNATLRFKAMESHGGEPVVINGCYVYALQFENEQQWNVEEGWK